MTVVKKATLKSPNTKTIPLALLRVEKNVFRWVDEVTGTFLDGVDYVEEADAVRALRVLVDTDPLYVGIDLTVIPVAPPAEDRAAKRILQELQGEVSADEVAAIIRNETAIDKLVESTNVLVAYLVQRIRQPRPAGLDLVQAALLIDVVTALEKAQNVDLANIKARLTEDVGTIKAYSSMPPGWGKPQ